jgi:large subunit ribosomal protein L5
MSYTPRLKEDYSNKIVNELKDKLQLDNIMQVPVLEKIVISRGVGAAVSDKKLVDLLCQRKEASTVASFD